MVFGNEIVYGQIVTSLSSVRCYGVVCMSLIRAYIAALFEIHKYPEPRRRLRKLYGAPTKTQRQDGNFHTVYPG